MSEKEYTINDLHDDTQRYVKAIEKDMAEKNIIDYQPSKDLWKECLPEGFTPEQAEKLSENQPRVAAALSYVLSQKGLPYMAENKDVKNVAKTIKYGKLVNITSTVDAEKQFPYPKDPSKKVTKYGHTVASVVYRDTAKKGDNKKVRDMAAAKGASLFSK